MVNIGVKHNENIDTNMNTVNSLDINKQTIIVEKIRKITVGKRYAIRE